ELEKAYRYYSMYIGAIIPNSGPLSGGTPVEIQGLFLTDAIDNYTQADQIYSLFFDVNPALFDDITHPNVPVITAASIDLANKIYEANSIFVVAPPGDALGFVDVMVLNDLGREPRAISDPLKYRYTDDLGIGQWICATVQPNPVGKLPPGHLAVALEVTGTIEAMEAAQVFIVPQGGNPDIPGHRIELVMTQIVVNPGGNTTWVGTNVKLIDTVTGTGEFTILTDGHAAIFILESDGNTVGFPGDDGNRIDPCAVEGRHFIIDTIPPRMLISDPSMGLMGIDFFNPDPSAASNSDVFRTLDIASSPLHPFAPVSVGGMVDNNPIPWDQSGIRRNQVDGDENGYDDFFPFMPLFDPSSNRAQIFYNTASIANNFAVDDLRFNLFVTFQDVDVYTTLGLTPTAADVDAFNPDITARQVAGFEFTPAVPPNGDRGDGILDGVGHPFFADAVLVKWDIQPMVTGTPDIESIETFYFTTPPLSFSASDISPNLAAANTVLNAAWNVYQGIAHTEQNMLIPVVFRGVDRAGNYFPQGLAENGIRKNWTQPRRTVDLGARINDLGFNIVTFDQTAGPLNLWWLVNTGTEFLETNIPGSENTRNPNFIWQNSSHADPETEPEPDRIFSYRLWSTDGTASREEARNGPYTALTGWSEWSAKDFLTSSEIQFYIEASEGSWMLLVVTAADEAGNVEQWPLSDLGNILGDPPIFVASNAGSSDNWRRWYVAPAEEVVETEVRPNFWHDAGPPNGVINPGETVLGNIEIVPLS
ncbi:MAG: hypothetical protein QGM45_11910, partial [Anaerolineales bacterium]|nr:hypothetical protein [Anaerolineales bacterium]